MLRRAAAFALWLMLAAVPLQALAQAARTVMFEVDMRAEMAAGRFDPATQGVGVRGSQAPLSWQRSLPAKALGEGRYGVEVRFERVPFGNQPVQYKFRIDKPGLGPDEGWENGANHPLVIDRAEVRVARAFNAAPIEVPPSRVGRIESLGVISSRHVSARAVQVWLPPGYGDDPARRHPVLYLHDGQNVFDGRAAGAEWMFDETAQRLAQAGVIEPPIIVAVDSTRDRLQDYTPTRMLMPAARTGTGRDERVGGGAPAYARFLIDELKPLIDRRFRTRPESASTAVGGASLGGLVSLWLALEHPKTFGAALVVSPSLWWDDRLPLREARARRLQYEPEAPRPRLWLDMGALEGPGVLDESRQLQQALMAQGWTATTLRYVEDAEGGHDEASWASRVEGMLMFLYGRTAAR